MGDGAVSDAPERIWLQDGGDYELAKQAMSDLTWCSDPIDEADTEYVRADLFSSALARAERAEAELAKLADPNAVHVSMLAGTVAKPSWDQIKHIYAREAERAEALLAEAVEAIEYFMDGWGLDAPEYSLDPEDDELFEHEWAFDKFRATLARIQEQRNDL